MGHSGITDEYPTSPIIRHLNVLFLFFYDNNNASIAKKLVLIKEQTEPDHSTWQRGVDL